MDELFRDPIWQFVGAILGLIAIVVTIIIFILQRRKKSLVYEILANTSLILSMMRLKAKFKFYMTAFLYKKFIF